MSNTKKKREFYGKIEDKPKTEQDLFALQDEFFSKREQYKKDYNDWKEHKLSEKPKDMSQKVWAQMLGILYDYAQSCIKKKNIKKAFTAPEDISDMALDASIIFMNQYRKKEDFRIGGSFAGLLKWKILEVKSRRRDEDSHYSLNQIVSSEENTELGDIIQNKIENYLTTNVVESPEDLLAKQTVFDLIMEVLQELDEEIGKDSRLAFLVRLYIIMVMRKPKTRHAKRLFMEQWAQNDYRIEQVIESTILEIQKRAESM